MIGEYDSTLFETDMVIYEKVDDKIKARVIVESKVDSVTTHDAITYSNKANYHKNVIPFVRYGIMCGNRGSYPLSGRLFSHYYTNEDSSKIYKQGSVETMKRNYMMFHTMAPEIAIEDLKEIYRQK